MTNQELFALMDRFEAGTLQSMKLSTGEMTIELTRGGAPAPGVPAAPPQVSQAPREKAAEPEHVLAAPLVGTFYAAPAPDRPPFVKTGDRVEKGQTVCLLEAMKMMSEVPAPCDCVIEEVLKASGDLAAFGDPLFRYRPC